jgi:hypothetical protein
MISQDKKQHWENVFETKAANRSGLYGVTAKLSTELLSPESLVVSVLV